jgi:hypothetical protein
MISWRLRMVGRAGVVGVMPLSSAATLKATSDRLQIQGKPGAAGRPRTDLTPAASDAAGVVSSIR